MSRKNSAPTLGWVVGSQITKWVTIISVGFVVVLGLSIFAITYSLKRDCTNLDQRNFKAFGYWLRMEAGMTKPGCPGAP